MLWKPLETRNECMVPACCSSPRTESGEVPELAGTLALSNTLVTALDLFIVTHCPLSAMPGGLREAEASRPICFLSSMLDAGSSALLTSSLSYQPPAKSEQFVGGAAVAIICGGSSDTRT